MTLKELQDKREQLLVEARERLDEIKSNTDEARAAELETQHDNAMSAFDAVDAKIERELKHKELEQRSADFEARANAPDPRRPNVEAEARGAKEEPAPEYKEVFAKAIRFGAGQLDAEERSILMDGRTDVPAEVRAQSVGTESAGGYTVPEDFSGELDKSLAMWGPMFDANIVRELNTSNGRDLPWPTVDDTAGRGRTKAENAAVDDDGSDDVAFNEKTLNAYVYDTGMVRIPIELLQDSAFAMQPLLNDLFGERLGRTSNEVLTNGTGTNEPNGIVTASGLGNTAASPTALAGDELIDLLHSVDPAYRQSPKSRWQFNDSTLAAIRKLKDGDGNYLWQMGDVRTGEPSRLLNYAYSINQAMPDIATGAKPILFGDHGRYVVRKVMGFQVMTLRERYAENFQVGMVGFKRFDGELLNANAVKHMVMA